MNSTTERLTAYSSFFDVMDVGRVATAADRRQQLQPGELFELFDVPEPTLIEAGRHDMAVLDIKPKGDHDTSHARVMHLAHANSLTARGNQAYQMAAVFSTDPTTRLIAVGNAGGPGEKAGVLSLADGRKVYKGDWSPLVDPVLRYLHEQKVETAEHVGYSAGASRVFPAALRSEAFDQRTVGVKAIEATDVVNRDIKRLPHLVAMGRLGLDFMRTGKALGGYVEANDDPSFVEARHDSIWGMVKYVTALGRATNLGITGALATDHFVDNATAALEADPSLTASLITATDSEITKLRVVQAVNVGLREKFGDRVRITYIEGAQHAMVNDLALQSLLVTGRC